MIQRSGARDGDGARYLVMASACVEVSRPLRAQLGRLQRIKYVVFYDLLVHENHVSSEVPMHRNRRVECGRAHAPTLSSSESAFLAAGADRLRIAASDGDECD